jgi:hypothetical protein
MYTCPWSFTAPNLIWLSATVNDSSLHKKYEFLIFNCTPRSYFVFIIIIIVIILQK